MTVALTFKIFAIWICILLLAVVNGALREVIFIPEFGKTLGFRLSGILLSLCIIVVSFYTLPWVGKRPDADYVMTGVVWLCLTLLFEFTFGFAQGKTWLQLFEAYTFKNGNIWPLVLVNIAISPYLAAKMRGWI